MEQHEEEITLAILAKRIDQLIALQQKEIRLKKISFGITIVFVVLPVVGSLLALPYLLSSVSSIYSGLSGI